MPARKNPRSKFGVEVTTYCAEKGITQRQLADQANVSYPTMMDAVRGKRPGYELVDKVREVMEGGKSA